MIRVVLPAFNEMASLPALLTNLESMFRQSRLDGEVIVVNDGSTDQTAEIVRNYTGTLSLRLVDLQPNRGLAGALRAGLTESVGRSQSSDAIVVMDADNTHPADLIPEMIARLGKGSNLVIASRYRRGSEIYGLTASRQLLSYAASILFRLIARVPGVRDYTCGFRAYRAQLLASALDRYGDALIEQKGFGCMAELLLKLSVFNPAIDEVPLILRYDLKKGGSKMKIWRAVKDTLRMLANYSKRPTT